MGFDIAGPEDGFLPARHREAFDYLAGEFFPVTVHAGEAAGIDSIRSAVLDGRDVVVKVARSPRSSEGVQLHAEALRELAALPATDAARHLLPQLLQLLPLLQL